MSHDLKESERESGVRASSGYAAPIAGRQTHSERELQTDHRNRDIRIGVHAVT